jgi:hypothetical protein
MRRSRARHYRRRRLLRGAVIKENDWSAVTVATGYHEEPRNNDTRGIVSSYKYNSIITGDGVMSIRVKDPGMIFYFGDLFRQYYFNNFTAR